MFGVVSLLSQNNDREKSWNVCVFISCMWHFRGATNEGAIMHTNLVMLDQEVGLILRLALPSHMSNLHALALSVLTSCLCILLPGESYVCADPS